jgi:hypothetical protein
MVCLTRCLARTRGAYLGSLPVWAYKPWAKAQHEYEEYTAPSYTYNEARRLGIVK